MMAPSHFTFQSYPLIVLLLGLFTLSFCCSMGRPAASTLSGRSRYALCC